MVHMATSHLFLTNPFLLLGYIEYSSLILFEPYITTSSALSSASPFGAIQYLITKYLQNRMNRSILAFILYFYAYKKLPFIS